MKKEKLLNNQIIKLRRKIDNTDQKIIKFLEKRLKLIKKLNIIKEKIGLPLTDPQREKEIIEKLKNLSKDLILKESLESIYQSIFQLSKLARKINQRKNCPFENIGIIGLGVIGGSIVKTLKYKNKNIKIFTLKINEAKEDIQLAQREKYLDGILDLENLLENSELIILAVPIESINPIAKEIKLKFKNNKKLLVIDVGSIKEKIAQGFEKLTNENIEFIPTHPMAGSEKSGFRNSKIGMFIDYPWIITPHSKNRKESIEKIKLFIEYLGSVPKILNPKEHDKLIARVSHLIIMISTFLFSYIYDSNKKYLEYSGTGFRTTTRLASANPLMRYQIYKNNFKNINRELRNFCQYLRKLKLVPENSFQFFNKYKKIRDKFLD